MLLRLDAPTHWISHEIKGNVYAIETSGECRNCNAASTLTNSFFNRCRPGEDSEAQMEIVSHLRRVNPLVNGFPRLARTATS